MNLNQLRQFSALAEELNFRRAAERLRISQPSLSQAIARLEKKLGGKLFTRDRRTVELTLAGHTLWAHATEILRMLDGADAAMREVFNGAKGHLRIGCVSSILAGPLGNILREFRTEYPNISIDVLEMYTMQQAEALSSKDIDIAILRSGVSVPEYERRILYSESLIVAISDQHKFASRSSLTVTDLRHEDFLLMGRPTGTWYAQSLLKVCASAGFTPNIVRECDDILTELALVSADFGVAIVPESVMLLRVPGVVYKPISSTPTMTTIQAVWNQTEGNLIPLLFADIATMVFQKMGRLT